MRQRASVVVVDLVTAAAIALATIAVFGSFVPLVPGPLLSLAGVLLYWWGTGYTDPSGLVLVGFILVALIGIAFDLFGSAIGASAGGGSTRTAVAAGLVGLLLIPLAGPLGVLIGVAAVTFIVAYRDAGDARAGIRAAAGATAGMLASVAVQALLTLAMLLGLLVVVAV